MAKTVRIPVLGQSVEEVRIVRWLKGVGDPVELGQPIAEVETDKTNIEWESPESGTILRILVPEGDYVAVEAPALLIGEPGESVSEASSPTDDTGSQPSDSRAVAVQSGPVPISQPLASPVRSGAATGGAFPISPRAQRMAGELGLDTNLLASSPGSGPKGRIVERDVVAFSASVDEKARTSAASPLAKAIAGTEGADLATMRGSGTGGRIVAADVRSAIAEAPVSPTTANPGEKRVPIAGLRKRVADNLARSVREKPHVTLNTRVDVGEMMSLRQALLPAIERETGVRISPTDLIVWACGKALAACPWMNGHVFDDAMVLFDQVHVGLAVSLGTEGLVVPVLRNTDSARLSALAADRARVVDLARNGKLAPSDLSGATFTVTNLGNYGIDSFNPIIPPPQIAILGVNTIRDEMVVVKGQPAVRPIMGLSLSFDHRAVDGAPAAEFLQKLVAILENPVSELG